MSLEQNTRRIKTEYDVSVGPEKKSETLTLNHGVGIDLLWRSESGSYRSGVRMKSEAPNCEIVESEWFWICAVNTECDYAQDRSQGKLPSLAHIARPGADGPVGEESAA